MSANGLKTNRALTGCVCTNNSIDPTYSAAGHPSAHQKWQGFLPRGRLLFGQAGEKCVWFMGECSGMPVLVRFVLKRGMRPSGCDAACCALCCAVG